MQVMCTRDARATIHPKDSSTRPSASLGMTRLFAVPAVQRVQGAPNSVIPTERAERTSGGIYGTAFGSALPTPCGTPTHGSFRARGWVGGRIQHPASGAGWVGGWVDLRYLRDLWAICDGWVGGLSAFVSSCLRRGRAGGPASCILHLSSGRLGGRRWRLCRLR